MDGSEPIYPMAEKQQGIILYTPDPYMSVQLMRAGWSEFVSCNWFKATPEVIAAKASDYIADPGAFHTGEAKQQLIYSMFVSLLPDWFGKTQPCFVRIEGDTLHLSTERTIRSGSKETIFCRTWRRAKSIVR